MAVERPDRAWRADIAYPPMGAGFLSLAATISRDAVARRPSITPDGQFGRDVLDEASGRGTPEVFNAGPGVGRPAGGGRRAGGHGRAADDAAVERPWRSAASEGAYLKGYASVPDRGRRRAYSAFYNGGRRHQSRGYRTPAEVDGGSGNRAGEG